MTKFGPNGFAVQEDNEGNLVEMIEEDTPDEGRVYIPMILRRADPVIDAEYKKLWDKVWWNRHMAHCELCTFRLNLTKYYGTPHGDGIGCDAARALEDRYGLEYLDPGEQVEWGITQGKMMALAWVHGSEWEGSGDT